MWSPEDEATLVAALTKAKVEGKWGDNNPKAVAWTACVAALAGSEQKSGGQPKDARAIRRRWQRVRAHHISWTICAFTSPSDQTRIHNLQEHAWSIWLGMGQRDGSPGYLRRDMEDICRCESLIHE